MHDTINVNAALPTATQGLAVAVALYRYWLFLSTWYTKYIAILLLSITLKQYLVSGEAEGRRQESYHTEYELRVGCTREVAVVVARNAHTSCLW